MKALKVLGLVLLMASPLLSQPPGPPISPGGSGGSGGGVVNEDTTCTDNQVILADTDETGLKCADTIILDGTAGTGTVVWTATAGWNLPDVGNTAAAQFWDMDADGDYDAMVYSESAAVVYGYRNTGTNAAPAWAAETAWNISHATLSNSDAWAAGSGSIALADLDADMDPDLHFGSDGFYGSRAFKNTGTSDAPVWTYTSAWNFGNIGSAYEGFTFGDLDGDGDLDVLRSRGGVTGVEGYENTGTKYAATWAAKTAWNFSDANIDAPSDPELADVDGDGDLDLFIGDEAGFWWAYKNTGTASAPTWVAEASWRITADYGYNVKPNFVDIDGDNDIDLFVSSDNGITYGYKNEGDLSFDAAVFFVTQYAGANKFTINKFGDATASRDLISGRSVIAPFSVRTPAIVGYGTLGLDGNPDVDGALAVDGVGNLTGPSGGFSIIGGPGASDYLILDGSAGTAGSVTITAPGAITKTGGGTLAIYGGGGSGALDLGGPGSRVWIDDIAMKMLSTLAFGWTSGASSAALDTGFARSAATVVRITNGSTGIGKLLTSVLVEPNTAGSGAPNVLAATESGTLLTNEGSTAQNYHTLPTAAAGLCFEFLVQDADGLRVVANTGDTIRIAGSASAAAGYIQNSTIGGAIRLCAINATEWFATSYVGTWTVDS